jgi:hypothetical protein
MRKIALANGRGIALVDDEDYDRLAQFSWQRSGRGLYVSTGINRGRRDGKWVITNVLMHRMVLLQRGNRTMYQQSPARLAPCRTESDDFSKGLAFVARRMLFSAVQSERAPSGSSSRPLARRVPLRVQDASEFDQHRAAVREGRRSGSAPRIHSRPHRGTARTTLADPFTAFAVETEAQGLTDIAQYKYARRPNDITRPKCSKRSAGRKR